jgi:hypothetical protein
MVNSNNQYTRAYMVRKRKMPEFLEKQRVYESDRRKSLEHGDRLRQLSRERYARLMTSPEYREKRRAYQVEKLKSPEFRARRDEQNRHAWLKRKYGLAPEEYDAMHRTQQGACAICGCIGDRWLDVDHEHVVGFDDLPPAEKKRFVRGLLCKPCNGGLGLFRDNLESLQQAIRYLGVRATW